MYISIGMSLKFVHHKTFSEEGIAHHSDQYETVEDCRKRKILNVRVCPEDKLKAGFVSKLYRLLI
jgi:hypothetical protein